MITLTKIVLIFILRSEVLLMAAKLERWVTSNVWNLKASYAMENFTVQPTQKEILKPKCFNRPFSSEAIMLNNQCPNYEAFLQLGKQTFEKAC